MLLQKALFMCRRFYNEQVLERHGFRRTRDYMQELGGVDEAEMYRTFNMGMGFLVVLDESEAKEACRIMGPGSRVIGSIVTEGLKAGSLTF